MSSTSAQPAAVHLAVYSDHAAASQDRDRIAELVDQNELAADGVVLVTRSSDGKIELEDAHATRKGAKLGTVGGGGVGVSGRSGRRKARRAGRTSPRAR
jgi:uncharacterized membrane protein